MKTSRRSAQGIVILLVGMLLLAPGLVWAVEEELKESGAKTPVANSDPKKDEKGETDETDEKDEKAEAKIDFNTLEDISAFRGSLAQLWAASPGTAPIEWREIAPAEPPAPEPAPLSNTKAP